MNAKYRIYTHLYYKGKLSNFQTFKLSNFSFPVYTIQFSGVPDPFPTLDQIKTGMCQDVVLYEFVTSTYNLNIV